jgi:1,4-dihydroxy-6-naphthoate synthase
LPADVQQAVNRIVRRSVEYAMAHPEASRAFVRANAQEMDENVMQQHIALYVNDYSIELGAEGRRAIEILFQRAAATGIIPHVPDDLFVPAASQSM